MYILLIAINKAEHVCVTVTIKYNLHTSVIKMMSNNIQMCIDFETQQYAFKFSIYSLTITVLIAVRLQM